MGIKIIDLNIWRNFIIRVACFRDYVFLISIASIHFIKRNPHYLDYLVIFSIYFYIKESQFITSFLRSCLFELIILLEFSFSKKKNISPQCFNF